MESAYQPPNDFTDPPRRRIWPYLAAGCAVVGLAMIAICAGFVYLGYRQVSGQGDVSVEVDKLFEDIAAGHAAEFYREQTSAEMKQATSEQKFVQFAHQINQRLGQLKSKTNNGFRISTFNLTTSVEASYLCKFERGPATVRTKFKHEHGQWLLQILVVDSPELTRPVAQQKCPHCGGLSDIGAKFCPHCGKEL